VAAAPHANPYAEAGVATAAGDRAVELMKAAVRRTHGPEVLGGVGGFAGLFDAQALTAYRRPLLATSTDGVGTKVAIAQAIDKHDTIGRDLVGMVVDDIVVVGARPLFMTDYIACGKVVPERIADIVAGIAAGCADTGTALVGGETAEHPGLLGLNDYDVAGAATGVVEADRVLGAERVRTGDAVLALASSGLHSNGYSLVRHIVAGAAVSYGQHAADFGTTWGEALLEPTRLYTTPLLRLIDGLGGDVHALSHVTGGGIAANLARVLPVDAWVELDRSTWTPPPVFHVLADLGGLDLVDTEGTWNLGIGFLAVIAADRVDAATAALAADGIAAWQVGVVGGGAPVGQGPVNQEIYDSLLLLQHRGQDSTGIATAEASGVFHLHKARGQVREAFRTRDMRSLLGEIGLGHCRYATKGTASSEEEAQPFYVNAPYGIVLVHNGNLTNTRELTDELFHKDRRHLNTSSDTELLVNVLAYELQASMAGLELDPEQVFQAVSRVHQRVEGSYAAIALIAGYGLLAFRDPFGIRPLIIGTRPAADGKYEWVVASESLVMENAGFEIVRDVMPGEAVFIDLDGHLHTKQCADDPKLGMGERLADTIAKYTPAGTIDVVMPIPDSSRPAAMQVARKLGIEYREGFYKNRYVGRTFIMPGQAVRKKSVRQKLNAMSSEFKGKNVLLIDDSIVRGTTSREIIQMARDAGAKSVTFASAAPPVRYPHVYGINMPSRQELVAHGRTIPEIAVELGCDYLVYQEVEDLKAAILEGSDLDDLDMSCFDGRYVTGTVTEEYLAWVEGSQES